MGTGTYYKIRAENAELKERLALYERGFSELAMEDNIVRTSKSFEKLFQNTKKDLKTHWERSEKEHKDWGFGFETLNEHVLEHIVDSMNEIPNVVVTFVIGKETERISLSRPVWEWIKDLGDDDPSKGLDKLVRLIPSE